MAKKRVSDVEKFRVDAVLAAWVQATKKAKSHNHPLIYVEHNKLVRIHANPNGSRNQT